MPAVLFLCLGNICRSPAAEAVLRKQGLDAGLPGLVIDSCGTGDWHVGHPPDPRMVEAGARRGYDLSPLRGRQLTPADFERFDLILAMDRANLVAARAVAPVHHRAKPGLLLDHAPDQPLREVPDPYYGGDQDFEHCLDLIEAACHGLIGHYRAG